MAAMSWIVSQWGYLILSAVLLPAVLVGAGLSGVPARRRKAARVIQRLGGRVEWLSESPQWLQSMAGGRLLPVVGEIHDVFLEGTAIDDDALARLAHLRNGLLRVRELFLTDAHVTDVGLANIRDFSSLEGLTLSGVPAGDESLAHLANMDRLETLSLIRTRVTDAGLERLKAVPTLQRLSLSGTSITDAGLAHLARLPQLRMLYLDDTAIGNDGLAHLQKLHTLELLSIKNTDVTNPGLRHLELLPRLRWLYVAGVRVSPAAIDALKRAHPHLTVTV